MNKPLPKTLHVGPREGGQGLQPYLQARLKLSGRAAKGLIDSRRVLVNGRRVWMARHVLREGDQISLPELEKQVPAAAKTVQPLELLYRDDWLLGVNKMPGCVTDQAADSLEARLRLQEKQPALRALHRLDRDTSGVLLFTLRAEDRGPYVELFRAHALQKQYWVIVSGPLPSGVSVLRRRLDGKEAESRFDCVQKRGGFALARCEIPTGRTHQIRRHLQDLGCRVAGDLAYGQQDRIPPAEQRLPRQMLHARELRFRCPHRNIPLCLQADPPADFQAALQSLGLKSL